MEPSKEFISNSIQNLIISYLNLHEFYIEELKNKTRNINEYLSEYYPSRDAGYGILILANDRYPGWSIRRNEYCKKFHMIETLNERKNKMNELFGLIQTNKYGKKITGYSYASTNLCFMNY